MSVLLEVNELKSWYGTTQALFRMDLKISAGEVVALLGRNGMGKTTTIKSIMGMISRCEGEIRFKGKTILRLPSYKIAQAGIGLVPEGRRCFAELTVHENLIVAARPGHWNFNKVSELFPRLIERRSQRADTLSGGEQQMLAIGRTLMTNPSLLILDEATEGLAPVVRQEIWAAIQTLRGHGLSILLVDKSIREILRISSECVIVEKGETCWTGTPDMLTKDVATQYLGV